jgi:hypothetical protein
MAGGFAVNPQPLNPEPVNGYQKSNNGDQEIQVIEMSPYQILGAIN